MLKRHVVSMFVAKKMAALSRFVSPDGWQAGTKDLPAPEQNRGEHYN